MKHLVISLCLVCTFCLCVRAQTTPPAVSKPEINSAGLTKAEQDILVQLITIKLKMGLCSLDRDSAECKDVNLVAQYTEQMKKAVDMPRVIENLVSSSVSDYEGAKVSVRSAPQASQIADEENAALVPILILQNQKIIALLEKIANKPK